ncbi:MAG: hypothetical protein RLZZ344_1479 [Pseudomonadota bacterium]|jgi:hypothetical protein
MGLQPEHRCPPDTLSLASAHGGSRSTKVGPGTISHLYKNDLSAMGHNQIKLSAAIPDVTGAENQALGLQIGQRLRLRPLTSLMGLRPVWCLVHA